MPGLPGVPAPLPPRRRPVATPSRLFLQRALALTLSVALIAGGAWYRFAVYLPTPAGTGRPVQAKPLFPAVSDHLLFQRYVEGRPNRTPVQVRGIYVTSYIAALPDRFNALVNLVDQTELNAMVIDIKANNGVVAFNTSQKLAHDVGAVRGNLIDLPSIAQTLVLHNIYSIARIVAFEDGTLARARPDLAVRTAAGHVFYDPANWSWTNPYKKEVWDYLVGMAKEAAVAGFREVQFDYVRFPAEGHIDTLVYDGANGKSRTQAIHDFLTYARAQLEPYSVYVSADVFGLTTTATDDMGIGQHFEDVASAVDYISPMVYPSHYISGNYHLPDPDAAPYETVHAAMVDAKVRLAKLDSPAIMRPWLQDFSLRHHYGPDEVRRQIQAVYDAGFKEWILWNPANQYTASALHPKGAVAGTNP